MTRLLGSAGAHLPPWQRAALWLAILVDLAFVAYLAWLLLTGLVWLAREVLR